MKIKLQEFSELDICGCETCFFVSFWLKNVGNRPRVNNGAIQFLPLLEKSLIKTKRL